MKVRKTFTLSKELFEALREFRWNNRIESYSEALEIALRHGLAALDALKLAPEREDVEAERKLNNEAYSRMRDSLAKYKGKYVVIARGELVAVSESLEGVYKALAERARGAKHALVKKIGEEIGVEREWQAFLERLR